MPRSYQHPDDLNGLTIDVQVAWEILFMDPAPAVTLAVLNRAFELSPAQLATALNVDTAVVQRWLSGSETIGEPETARILDLSAVASHLLRFECFLTPAAAGRWMSMPRRAATGSQSTTSLDQVAEGRYEDAIAASDALLSGNLDRPSPFGERQQP